MAWGLLLPGAGSNEFARSGVGHLSLRSRRLRSVGGGEVPAQCPVGRGAERVERVKRNEGRRDIKAIRNEKKAKKKKETKRKLQ